jgi:hypothetical protein
MPANPSLMLATHRDGMFAAAAKPNDNLESLEKVLENIGTGFWGGFLGGKEFEKPMSVSDKNTWVMNEIYNHLETCVLSRAQIKASQASSPLLAKP